MTMREPVSTKWNGAEYVGRYAPTMAGEWEIDLEARREGQLLLSIPSTIQVESSPHKDKSEAKGLALSL